MKEVLIGVFSALVGFISGLVAPWIKWQVEKRRARQEYRRELIRSWRDAIEAEEYDFADYRSSFGSSAVYASLRVHMRPEIIKKVETPTTFYARGPRGDEIRKQMLLDEVARIEKLWKLV